jgi:hypothetical protein
LMSEISRGILAIWRLFLARIEGVLRVEFEEVVGLEIPLWEVSQRTRLLITGSKVGPDDKVCGAQSCGW